MVWTLTTLKSVGRGQRASVMLHGAQDRNTITLATGISILMAVGRIRLAKFLGLMMCSVLGTVV